MQIRAMRAARMIISVGVHLGLTLRSYLSIRRRGVGTQAILPYPAASRGWKAASCWKSVQFFSLAVSAYAYSASPSPSTMHSLGRCSLCADFLPSPTASAFRSDAGAGAFIESPSARLMCEAARLPWSLLLNEVYFQFLAVALPSVLRWRWSHLPVLWSIRTRCAPISLNSSLRINPLSLRFRMRYPSGSSGWVGSVLRSWVCVPCSIL